MSGPKPVLVIGYGNPGRGDDGAGPELVARLEALRDAGELPDVFDTAVDYQLQIELASDMHDRRLVIFVDAAANQQAAVETRPLRANRDRSYSSHELSPEALLDVQRRAFGSSPSRCELIAISGSRFDLGATLSEATRRGIDLALASAAEQIRAIADKQVPSGLPQD